VRSLKAVIAAAAVVLVTAAPAGAGSTRVVTLQDVDIAPSAVRIARGATVEWRFLDERAPHDVTSRGRPRFRSSVSKTGGTHRVRFTRRGTYRYACTIHPSMRGKVVVR